MDGISSSIQQELAMAIVTLRLPDVKRKTEIRPQKCPSCSGETFQRWGQVIKAANIKVD